MGSTPRKREYRIQARRAASTDTVSLVFFGVHDSRLNNAPVMDKVDLDILKLC